MNNISKIFLFLVAALVFSTCTKFDEDVHNDYADDSMAEIRINFTPSFTSQNMITRSGSTVNLATAQEVAIRDNNVNLFVFSNDTFKVEGSEVVSVPDPDGVLLHIQQMEIDQSTDESTFPRFYRAKISPINQPVTVLGVANIKETMLTAIWDAFNRGEPITYRRFSNETSMIIATEEVGGYVAESSTNKVLKNAKAEASGEYDTYLPLSVLPIQLPSLTEEVLEHNPDPESIFGYARIDVMLYGSTEDTPGMTPEQMADVKLLSARLANVPTLPIYNPANEEFVSYIDYTNAVTPATNIPTEESNNYMYDLSEEAGDVIQGLYMYPNVQTPESSTDKYTYIIIEAVTPMSETEEVEVEVDGAIEIQERQIPEFYKILIKYDDIVELEGGGTTTVESHSITHNVRYRLKILKFEGNGYQSLEEALDNPPSNVQYDITIDSSKGNEFVVTNGTSYMGLSNTVVDMYGTYENLRNREFEGVEVYFRLNENIKDSKLTPDEWAKVEKSITVMDDGLEVLNEDDFEAYFQQDELYSLRFILTDKFFKKNESGEYIESSGKLSIRVGNLVQSITVNYKPFDDNDVEINDYVTTRDTDGNVTSEVYSYAYLDYGEEVTSTIASWIRFGDTTNFEYSAEKGADGIYEGVPIVMPRLATGQRDNFHCPVYFYNINGESVRTYIYQEDLDVIDFADASVVAGYIGGTFAGKTAQEDLVVSNCYMLNPGTGAARKYYIPVSKRIKEVWSRVPNAVPTATDPVQGYVEQLYTNDYEYTETGEFVMPQMWDVKVLWYDSERVHAGMFKIQKEPPFQVIVQGPDGADSVAYSEDRFSILIPANVRNFGNIQVAVVDGKNGSGELDSETGEMKGLLWSWTLWITDYDPMLIARNQTPNDTDGTYKEGTYTAVGYYEPSDGFIQQNAIHQYTGDVWDGVNKSMYGNRFIMDRSLGAFENTGLGHGTVYNSTYSKVVSEPVQGSLLYQHANPRPYPGIGALRVDSSGALVRITSFERLTYYSTVIDALRHPYNFCIGTTADYSHWLHPDDPAADRHNMWGDKTLRVRTESLVTGTYFGVSVTYTEDDKEIRASKSVFDPSPLGWMMPSRSTFRTISDGLEANQDVNKTMQIHNDFARFYNVAYRGSSNGLFQLPHLTQTYSVGYFRTNETKNQLYSDKIVDGEVIKIGYRDDWSFKLSRANTSVEGAGKAAGCSIRPVSQAEYGK